MDISYNGQTLRLGSRPHFVQYEDGTRRWERMVLAHPSEHVTLYETYVDRNDSSLDAACERLCRRMKEVAVGT